MLLGMDVYGWQVMALTLLLVSQPMFEKLERIKDKYGMMEG